MSAMDTDPYTDDTFHTHLAYHCERVGEVWVGCKWCMRERPLADYKKNRRWWAKKRPIKPS